MRKKQPKKWLGCGVSSGIVFGEAHLVDTASLTIPQYWISDREVHSEVYRFKKVMEEIQRQLFRIRDKLCKFQIGEEIRILDSYQMIARDELLFTSTIRVIELEKINAEWALNKSLDKIKSSFSEADSDYFKERRADIDHVGKLILKSLLSGGALKLKRYKKGTILVAHDLSPADTAQITRGGVEGFITEIGGMTSHTAIIAKALEIPAVTGVEGLANQVFQGDQLILDGNEGLVIQNPNVAQVKKYRALKEKEEHLEKLLLKEAHLPTKTRDDFSIRLAANMELLDEIPLIKKYGAEALGLYRTEFLYLKSQELPTEEEQFLVYKEILASLAPASAVIRTLDIGGDKLLPSSGYNEGINPALGMRAIRFCLKEKKIFKTQLRAMLRASPFGKLKILIPMVSSIDEIRQIKKILEEIKTDLKNKKIPYDSDIKFGVMIEVPAAALMADSIASEVDFMSIGTNDLIQYTLAIDRINDHISYLYEPLHPAVLRLLKHVVEAGRQKKIEVSLCGEMAGDPLYLLILLGLGLSELSMNPCSIPRVKRILRQVTFKTASDLFDKALTCKTASEVKNLVKREMAKIEPLAETRAGI